MNKPVEHWIDETVPDKLPEHAGAFFALVLRDFFDSLGTKDKIKFSVVIPCRNENKNGRLRAILEDLAREPGLGEIIIVENNSDDDNRAAPVVETFRAAYPSINVKLVNEGVMVADARNAGHNLASYPVTLFLDADTRFEPGLTKKALDEFTARGLDAATITFTPNDGTFSGKFLLDIFAFIQKIFENTSRPVCAGAALMAKRGIGAFPQIKVCEDVLWAQELAQSGYKVANLETVKFVFDMSRFRDPRTGKIKVEMITTYLKTALHFGLTGQPHPDMFRLYKTDRDGNPYGLEQSLYARQANEPFLTLDFWKRVFRDKITCLLSHSGLN